MTIVSMPLNIWNFIIEKSWWQSFSKLFKSEPLDNVWLLSLSEEWHWSTFIIEISHSIIPSLSWVSIYLPSMSFFSGCPVWNSESLENSSWSSVEWCISNSFQKSFWMEILCIDVEHEVWFFMEFLNIKVFDSNTFIIKTIILNDYAINIPASLAFSTWNL